MLHDYHITSSFIPLLLLGEFFLELGHFPLSLIKVGSRVVPLLHVESCDLVLGLYRWKVLVHLDLHRLLDILYCYRLVPSLALEDRSSSYQQVLILLLRLRLGLRHDQPDGVTGVGARLGCLPSSIVTLSLCMGCIALGGSAP